jgi:hypothetical protein
MIENPDFRPDEARAAGRFAESRVDCMPDPTRWGVRLIGVALRMSCVVRVRRSFMKASPQQREILVRSVAGVRLPIVGEYVRLARGLALAGYYNHRDGPT